MELKQWSKVQSMIDAGIIEPVIDVLVREVSENLTPGQFEKLGDVRGMLLNLFPAPSGVTAEQIVKHVIDLGRKGAITDP